MRRVAIWILFALLVASAVYALGVQARRMADRNATLYTDGSSIQIPKDEAPVRSILWTPPVPLQGGLNTEGEEYHPALSPDGAALFFARGPLGGAADLYWSKRTAQGWSEAEPIDAVNTDSSDEITPWVSPDGTTLVFATDRPQGRGGYDLWLSRFENDSWSSPVPLPDAVNSPHNDYAPSLSPDGLWLWFASNRPRMSEDDFEPDPLVPPPSAGDYDLYRSAFAGVSSTRPTRIDALSSTGDDVAPAWSPAGDFVYFASNREGGAGGFDLYRSRISDGAPLAPIPLGPPINTPADELDPALGMGGFELLLSAPVRASAQDDRPDFDLLRSESREVFTVVDRSRSSLDWANLWRLFGPWLLWLLLLLALLLLLLKFKSSDAAVKRWRKLGLFARCLLLSVLLHALLLALLGVWRVSTTIGDLLDDGASRVRLTSSAGSVASQLRGGFDAPSTQPAHTTSHRAQPESVPTEAALAQANPGATSLVAERSLSEVSESSQAPQIVTSAETPPMAPDAQAVNAPSPGAGDALSEQAAHQLSPAHSAEPARADAWSTSQGSSAAALESPPSELQAQRAASDDLGGAPPQERVVADHTPSGPSPDVEARAPETIAGERVNERTATAAVERASGSSARGSPEPASEAALALQAGAPPSDLAPLETQLAQAPGASAIEPAPARASDAPLADAGELRTLVNADRPSPREETVPPGAADRLVVSDPRAARITDAGAAQALPGRVDAGETALAPSKLDALAASDAPPEARAMVSSADAIEPGETHAQATPTEAPALAATEGAVEPPTAQPKPSARAQGLSFPADGIAQLAQAPPGRVQAETETIALPAPVGAIAEERIESDAVAPNAVAGQVAGPADQLAREQSTEQGAAPALVASSPPVERPGLAEAPSDEAQLIATRAAPSSIGAEPTRAGALAPSDAPRSPPLPTATISASPGPEASVPGETLASRDAPEGADALGRPVASGPSPRAPASETTAEQEPLALTAINPIRLELERTANAPLAASDAPPIDRLSTPSAAPTPPPTLAPLAMLETAPEPEATADRVGAVPLVEVTALRSLARPAPAGAIAEQALATLDPRPSEDAVPRAMDRALPDAIASDPQPQVTSPLAPLPRLASAPMPEPEPEPEVVYPQRDEQIRRALVERGGGSEQTEKAVAEALAWLARNQSPDGRWSSRGFEEFGGRSGDPARYDFDVASTGLALLCFLGADHTPDEDGPYRETVAKGLAWLLSVEGPPGDFRMGESMYSQGIATIALCEGYAMTGDERLLPPIERAIAFITGAKNPSIGGWRYEPGQAGDTSVLGWMVMAMKSAQRCGIDVPQDSMDAAGAWLELVMDDRWDGRYSYRPGMDATHSMTAEGMFVQQLLGIQRQDQRMSGSARFVLQELPRWDAQSPTYAWYYATLALFQHGGGAWTRWNRAVSRELVRAQRKDGPAAGSWDPTDRYARIGGRIYQTAICTLSLEVYYRYLPMYVDEPEGVGGE